MNVGKYIYLLLPEHDTVIIPGLGAFVSSYKAAKIDEKSGEMTPPSKEISFEPKIKNNDGLLVGKIAEVEGIPFTEANKELNYAREEMLYRLDKGEKVKLESIGELYYDPEGVLKFNSSGKNFLLLDAYGLEKGSIKDQLKKQPLRKVIPPEKPKLVKPPVAAKEQKPASKAKTKQATPPRTRRKSWWLLLLLIPLLAATIYIISRNTQRNGGMEQTPVQEIPIRKIPPPVDTTDHDTVEVEGEVAVENKFEIDDSTGFIKADSSKYYLIRGSFEDFENAQKFFNRLKREGYNPFHLGKYGSFFLVGINVYENPIEAYGQQYNYLDKYPESGVWIFAPGKTNHINDSIR